MKMRKILNGVLACTMALSMVSVASVAETVPYEANNGVVTEKIGTVFSDSMAMELIKEEV